MYVCVDIYISIYICVYIETAYSYFRAWLAEVGLEPDTEAGDRRKSGREGLVSGGCRALELPLTLRVQRTQ